MKQYKLNNETKIELEEFTEELYIITRKLKKVLDGNYGAKTAAREVRNILTEIKKKITPMKRKTIELFEG